MCGMSEKEFLHSTLNSVNLRLKKYKEEKEYHAKEIEYQSWLTGLYVQNAIASCFNKKLKYPKNPLEQEKSLEEIELTEEQADFYRHQFLKRLQRMEKKFNKKSKNNKGED